MYVNVAYGIDENPNLQDLSVPLKINNCGYYRLIKTPVETERPNGQNDYQLMYIAAGKVRFNFNNSSSETVVQKGNMVLFRPNEPQNYRYYPSDKTEVYWLHFTGNKIEEYLERYELPKNENVFFTGISPDYQWLYNQIIRELQLQRANYEELLKVLFQYVLITINRYIKEGNETGANMVNDMEKAAHFFNENYNKDISIEEYATSHLMSVNWFIYNFKKIMKVTPMQFILSLRIAAAKRYLETTTKGVSEVASSVGYDNSLYFSRVFKKHTGLSPSEYRKIYKTI